MGYGLKVLLPVADYEDYSVREIHDCLINDKLWEDFGTHEFDHFSLWHMSEYNGSFLGKDDPQRLIAETENWNKEILSSLEKELEKIVVFNKPEEIVSFFQENEFEAFRLREALSAFDNSFQYGGDRLVYDEDGCYTVMIPEEMMEDIKENPQDYALIDVTYH